MSSVLNISELGISEGCDYAMVTKGAEDDDDDDDYNELLSRYS